MRQRPVLLQQANRKWATKSFSRAGCIVAAIMAADETTKKWWKVCGPLQQPLETRKEGEWWAGMEEVFHVD